MKNFPGLFRSPRMFKYKEKTTFTYNIRSVVHCRKFSMKQNVDVSCSEFRFRWTYLHMVSTVYTCSDFRSSLEKCMNFKDIFPGHSRTLSFNFQDFPGPKWFSRTFQVLEFSRKKIDDFPGLFRRRGNRSLEMLMLGNIFSIWRLAVML